MARHGLIYIAGTYKNFVQESKAIGVNRRVPLNSLSSYSWGDPILCGVYQSSQTKPERVGDTKLLGYFPILRLSLIDSRLYKAVLDHLELLGLIDWGEYKDEFVNRHCGDYTVVEISYVKIPLPDLVKLIRMTGRDLGITPRVMIGGELFYEYEDAPILTNTKFNRGLCKVEWNEIFSPRIQIGGFALISNYRQYGKDVEENKGNVRDLLEFIG